MSQFSYTELVHGKQQKWLKAHTKLTYIVYILNILNSRSYLFFSNKLLLHFTYYMSLLYYYIVHFIFPAFAWKEQKHLKACTELFFFQILFFIYFSLVILHLFTLHSFFQLSTLYPYFEESASYVYL